MPTSINAAPSRLTASSLDPAQRIARAVEQILDAIGEDPSREGVLETPDRVARALLELTAGYHGDPGAVIGDALFTEESARDDAGLVVVSDIAFHSLCEHHMLPFQGVAHVGYVHDGRVVGLSKLPRLVEMYARRLQVQERITAQVADALQAVARPRGVAVMIEATHACMSMRGVRSPRSRTTTFAWRGVFRDDTARREEFRAAVGGRRVSVEP